MTVMGARSTPESDDAASLDVGVENDDAEAVGPGPVSPEEETALHEDSAQSEESARVDESAYPEFAGRKWNLVTVSDVVMNLPSAYPEIVLRESEDPYREMRIPVGLAEGTAIAHAWKNVSTPRPLTHEMVSRLLTMHNITIACVRITDRREKVLFAELDTTSPRGRRIIPCRPSDAIALALRQPLPTPMLVVEELIAESNDLGQ
jgi:uncharacterized protein